MLEGIGINFPRQGHHTGFAGASAGHQRHVIERVGNTTALAAADLDIGAELRREDIRVIDWPASALPAAVRDAAGKWSGPIPGRGTTRIVVAGAPPPTRTIERVETELGWEFAQIYGLTETTPLLTMNRGREEYDHLSPTDRAVKLSRAGAPALGVEMRVSPDGEVLARGNHIMAGYWNQPEATADAIKAARDDAAPCPNCRSRRTARA